MSDPPIIKEVVLSKRRRSEAAQLSVVNIDSYQKQRKNIALIPKSRNQEAYIDLLENPPNYAEGTARLYSWSLNHENSEPFRKFLDLIGYSEDEFGEPLGDWKKPSKFLGYMELGYLAQGLEEYSNRPQDVENYARQLLEAETR
jgi:hypothetical protein